jgi:two-component system response regulator PilR (NtrC family)
VTRATLEPNRMVSAKTNGPEASGAKPSVLVVDDEPSMRDMLQIVLRRDGYEVRTAQDGRHALESLQHGPVDLLLSDIRMPDMTGVDVLRAAKDLNPDIVALMMTAYASTGTAVEAMRLGAVDYLTKPFNMDELRLKVRQQIETRRLKQENVLLKKALESRHVFANIIGRSNPMLALFEMIEAVAQTTSTVLICGAVPETLLESELFGHVKGAFTGADGNRKGLIEAAERGSIFLDEIGEMNATMQVKLLRVLQDKRFRRLGGTDEVQADIRVLAATNQDLPKRVTEGRFREDLFYRLNVIAVHLPPLRERREDITLLADHFLAHYAGEMKKPVPAMSEEAEALLLQYHWPGNVRELENVMERAVALEHTSVVRADTLPPAVRGGSAAMAAISGAPAGLPDLGEGFDLEARGDDFYRHYLSLALDRAGGVQVKAAEMLGMSIRSFRYYARKYKLR